MAPDWKEEYRRKTASAAEAVGVIKSGDRVSFTHGREPPFLRVPMTARNSRVEEC